MFRWLKRSTSYLQFVMINFLARGVPWKTKGNEIVEFNAWLKVKLYYTSAGIFNSYWVPLWTKFISSTSLFIENDPPTVCQLTTHLTISEADVRLLNRILKKMKSISQNIFPFFMIKVMITHFIFTSVASPRILARTREGLVFLFMQARTTIEAKG